MKQSHKNKIFINDGNVTTIKIAKDSQIPEGWVRGRGKENKVWINDEKGNSKKISNKDILPDGWVYGRSSKK